MDLQGIDFQEIFGIPQTAEQPVPPPPRVTNSALKQAEKQALNELEPELAPVAQMVFTDPGFDISPNDNELWLYLFTKAREISFELHAKLFYLRSVGVILVPSKKYGYMIKAIIDPEGKKGFTSKDAYIQEKQCLDTYKGEIVFLLRKLQLWEDGEGFFT